MPLYAYYIKMLYYRTLRAFGYLTWLKPTLKLTSISCVLRFHVASHLVVFKTKLEPVAAAEECKHLHHLSNAQTGIYSTH